MFSKHVPPSRQRPELPQYCILPFVQMPPFPPTSSGTRSTAPVTTVAPNMRPMQPPPANRPPTEQSAQIHAPAAPLRAQLNVQIHVSTQHPPPPQPRRPPHAPPPSPDARRRRPLLPSAPPAAQPRPPPAHAPHFHPLPGVQVRVPHPFAPPPPPPPPAHAQTPSRGPHVYVNPVAHTPVMSIFLSGPAPTYGRPPPGSYGQPPPPRNVAFADAPPPYAEPSGEGHRRINRPPPQPQHVRSQPVFTAGIQYAANPANSAAPQNVTYTVPIVGTWQPAYFSTIVPPQNAPYTPYLGGNSWQSGVSFASAPSEPPPSNPQQGNGPLPQYVAFPGAPRGTQNLGGGSSIHQPSTQYPTPPTQTVPNPVRIGVTVNDGNVDCYMAHGMVGQDDDPYKYINEYAQQEGPDHYGRGVDLEQHLDNFCNNLQCYHDLFQERSSPVRDDRTEQEEGETSTSFTSSEQSPVSAIDEELTGRIVNDALDVLNDFPENEVTSSGIDLAE